MMTYAPAVVAALYDAKGVWFDSSVLSPQLSALRNEFRMNRAISPDQIAPPAANYVHAVLSEHAGKLLHTSGVVPVDVDGTVPEDIGAQARVVWANITAILAEAGMTAADIVSVTTYAVAGEDLGPVMAERDAALGGHKAASTLVTVPELAQPAWRVEAAIVAAQ